MAGRRHRATEQMRCYTPAVGRHNLLGARGQAQARLVGVLVVGHNSAVVAGRAGQGAVVARLGLDVAHNGTLGHGGQGQNVANGQGGCSDCACQMVSDITCAR